MPVLKQVLIYLVITAGLAFVACKELPTTTASYLVVPMPQNIAVDTDGNEFKLNKNTRIAIASDTLSTEATLLQDYIEQLTGHKLEITKKIPTHNAIVLRADLKSDNREAYELQVSAKLIEINGATSAGTFYGIQTLRKSIPEVGRLDVIFPAVKISDEPRFAYRGAHFDVARHFFSVDSVKTFIDMLALHNVNTFHWHLTDDQGWRIEIKSRPRLTELGSSRDGTAIGHTQEVDTITVSGYFTQDQIRDIIDYASDRHINVIPEIDLPGHMIAALKGYPEMGCTGGPYEVWKQWGVSEDLLCAGNDSTYAFLDDVLGEIADLFPADYVHIGGDECPKTRWERCPKCQAKIAEIGLISDKHSSKEEKLQGYIMYYAADFLASKGKRVIGWDEMLEVGAYPGSVVMSWRGEKGGIDAAKQGFDAIMAPNTYLYFDYYQTLEQDDEPSAIGGYIPLEMVYGYEPISENFTDEEARHIIGIQANLWTEHIKTFSKAQYMELPRLAALADVQWSNAPKDYNAFLHRVQQLITHYKANGYNYSTRAFDISSEVIADPDDRTIIVTLSTPDGAPIHFTTDGSDPTSDSPLYENPIRLQEPAVIKSIAIRPIVNSRVHIDSISFNKSTARHITLLTNPDPRYSGVGALTLVNGVRGGQRYSSQEWLGFTGNDAVAVIDLGEPTEISKVGTRTAVQTGVWIFDTRGMKVELSDDGVAWRTVGEQTFPPLKEPVKDIVKHSVTFAPQNARYIKVTIESEKHIPQWHEAHGKPGFVFIDEITVR